MSTPPPSLNDPYRSYEVHLTLKCAAPDCAAERGFVARTRKLVEAEARRAGWSMPRSVFAYCPEHKGLPPAWTVGT